MEISISDSRALVVRGDHEDNMFLVMDNGFLNSSEPNLIVGDVTGQQLIAPSPGHKLTLKGITVLGDGTTGKVYIKRSSDGAVILPTYFSAQSRAGTSAALNIKLGVDEYVYVDTVSRGVSAETFIGISYIELKD